MKIAVTLLLWTSIAVGARADQTPPVITMHYYERPPFMSATAKGVEGLAATPAQRAFARIGTPLIWKATPVYRILPTVRANKGLDCAVGWYKTPERESYAKFSKAIYLDKAPVGLTRIDSPLPDGLSAAMLMTRPSIHLLVRRGIEHGPTMKRLIAAMPAHQVEVLEIDVPSMIKMIDSRRANLTIVTAEEAEIQIAQSGRPRRNFRLLTFPDVPPLDPRYILCSQRVPDEVIRRLDDAIGQLVP